jgi:hypothetical protein
MMRHMRCYQRCIRIFHFEPDDPASETCIVARVPPDARVTPVLPAQLRGNMEDQHLSLSFAQNAINNQLFWCGRWD